MKKRIIAILLAALMLLTACGKASDTPAPSDNTQPANESTPTEPEATEPTPAPSAPESSEQSKDDLSYYPYPLLDMTYGEIETLYGELTAEFGIAGGSCPYVPQVKILLEYSTPFNTKIPDD